MVLKLSMQSVTLCSQLSAPGWLIRQLLQPVHLVKQQKKHLIRTTEYNSQAVPKKSNTSLVLSLRRTEAW